MDRQYQYNYSATKPSVYSVDGRRKKAATMVAVIKDHLQRPLYQLAALDVGSSSGIIDAYLADEFKCVTGIDIDAPAMEYAQKEFSKHNLKFEHGDAMNLRFEDDTFDVVVCSHVYEHVPDAETMFREIFRVLKPRGVCYFSGNNRFIWMEPHYRLPLLSVVPRFLAHFYIRLAGKGDFYHEKHLSYWGLKRITRRFTRVDYTLAVISDPEKYHIEYMLTRDTSRWHVAKLVARHFYWATPHIWLLEKPAL